jgi:predicted 3-demethylubiquinone-9 3-methyltransferase (glyoxalase superfamily)
MLKSSRIKPFLWFDDQAEQAAKFYTSVFKNSKMGSIYRFPEGSPRPTGMVMTVEFELEGQPFVALNGGPEFQFTPAVSFCVECEDQAEIDYYWDKLVAGGGKPVQCGWLADRYGLSWQIVPKDMDEYFSDKDPKRAERMMRAIHTMVKLDIAKLEEAAR